MSHSKVRQSWWMKSPSKKVWIRCSIQDAGYQVQVTAFCASSADSGIHVYLYCTPLLESWKIKLIYTLCFKGWGTTRSWHQYFGPSRKQSCFKAHVFNSLFSALPGYDLPVHQNRWPCVDQANSHLSASLEDLHDSRSTTLPACEFNNFVANFSIN